MKPQHETHAIGHQLTHTHYQDD